MSLRNLVVFSSDCATPTVASWNSIGMEANIWRLVFCRLERCWLGATSEDSCMLSFKWLSTHRRRNETRSLSSLSSSCSCVCSSFWIDRGFAGWVDSCTLDGRRLGKGGCGRSCLWFGITVIKDEPAEDEDPLPLLRVLDVDEAKCRWKCFEGERLIEFSVWKMMSGY